MPENRHRNSSTMSPLMAVGAVMLVVIAVYGVVRIGGRGEVLGAVQVLDVELGGATRQVATQAVAELEDRLVNLSAPVTIGETTVGIIPVQTGFQLDVEGIVEAAMSVGRSSNPVADFFFWIGHLAGNTAVQPQGTVDEEALDQVLEQLDASVVGEPPFEGAISIEDGELVAEYPRPGKRIDRQQALERLTAQFLTLQREPVALPVRTERPQLTRTDLDAARERAGLMLSAPVTLSTNEGTSLSFSREDLRNAFMSRTMQDPARIELGFDPSVIELKLADVRSEFEAAPINARYEISGYEVSIIPGRNGTLLDGEQTATALEAAAKTSVRSAVLPLEEGAEPEVTTAELEELDVQHLVAQFTTYHDCCAARVTNIHLIADEVDGATVPPGATFSLNEYVGRRTEEEGYLPAGTIIAGEIVDTIGGGVSQFATTFYGAVFWGGYEDVSHKPHSFYFSRYPEGIEATISWPQPDLAFRNNDDSGVLIKTEYTDTSITVKFYGNNEGRILAGDQSGGQLGVGVVAEGGPGAKEVRGDRSERFDFRDPPETLYRGNENLEVDEEVVVQSPDEGWSLTVTRTITINGETTTEEWPVRYLPQQEIIEVHPCKVPDSGVSCPTTTTTTIATTTTTTPPSTTQPQSTSTTASPPTTAGD